MTSAFGAQFSHRLCLLRPPNLRPLLLGPDLRSDRWLGFGLASSGWGLAILFKSRPTRIDRLLGKARQLGQEFMGRFGEDCLALVFVGDSHHVASITGGKIAGGR
jgi:hypothetical protein